MPGLENLLQAGYDYPCQRMPPVREPGAHQTVE